MEFPYDKKMKKLFKTMFLSLFVAFTLCLSLGSYVFATENEAEAGDSEGEAQTEQTDNNEQIPETTEVYSPSLHITVQYSTGMAIQSGDIFRIYYRLSGTTDDAIIELDASQLAGATGKLDMNVGSYIVSKCEYTGTNADIISQGYALTSSFNITDNASDYAQLRLYIGTESATLLSKEYSGVKGYTGTNESYEFSQNAPIATTETETVAETTEQPDTQAGIDAPDTNSSTEEQATEEATTEEEKPEPQPFSARPLIPVMIIAIIGALVILWARKSGKI